MSKQASSTVATSPTTDGKTNSRASGDNKAVVFTHLSIKLNEFDRVDAIQEWLDNNESVFDAYVTSRSIGLVYMYISMGIENVMLNMDPNGKRFEISSDLLEREERIRNVVRIALDGAASRCGITDPPSVVLVGLLELMSLLNRLMRMDPRLITNLAGCSPTGAKVYAYDAPKFVEAVIRIVRGFHHAAYPVLRIDADVVVNDDAVRRILDRVRPYEPGAMVLYDFFSGSYGGPGPSDPINDHAVRTHWLWDFPKGSLPDGHETFLRDLQEVGARQVDSAIGCSAPAAALVSLRGRSKIRSSAQVISGAGLFMSLSSILRLPPDMNADHMIVWIDDYLRRLMHEAVGDIPSTALERISDARFAQDRHPKGISPKDVAWAENVYFERLLRGCLMEVAVMGFDGSPGPLAQFVKDVLDRRPGAVTREEERKLHDDVQRVADERFGEVMQIWEAAYYGNDILVKWARARNNSKYRSTVCAETADDAVGYAKLVTDWPKYVQAIQDLQPFDAYWIFRPVP